MPQGPYSELVYGETRIYDTRAMDLELFKEVIVNVSLNFRPLLGANGMAISNASSGHEYKHV